MAADSQRYINHSLYSSVNGDDKVQTHQIDCYTFNFYINGNLLRAAKVRLKEIKLLQIQSDSR